MFLQRIFAVLVTAVCFVVVKNALACNEAICASVVSKCMLQQICECKRQNYTCFKECYNCLSDLFDDCCHCIDLCPKNKVEYKLLGEKSHIEDFENPIPDLFQSLTSEPDPDRRWVSYTYSIDLNFRRDFSAEKGMDFPKMTELENEVKPETMTTNCTVAYFPHCISWNECKASCRSMGATSYRWFHDSCCECIGNTCINYGINESRCTHCPNENDTNDLTDDYDDYGQDEDEHY